MKTITVDYHNLPNYLRSEAAKEALKVPGVTFGDVLKRRVLFTLDYPTKEFEHRKIVNISTSKAK